MADYISNYSGDEIDTAIESVVKTHKGTQTITLATSSSYAYNQIIFDGYVPSMVVASLRQIGGTTPTPYYNYVASIIKTGNNFYSLICSPLSDGSTVGKINAGTYYIDYIAFE